MCREISWMRQERAPVEITMLGANKPEYIDGGDFGWVRAFGCPVYDNGSYFVIDVVKDLEWAVMSTEFVTMKKFPLDKYGAIMYADELKDADERAG